ncbi:flagellar basal body L-ring protein [candidate division LCP-89 bacterium B3_LCP]|uniref:Flagellar L-ring protein n=1 Tax=candidate division LCP-89 bacterium B3_LCP TaxID=2012998 RepID=A0A532UZ97_UNCL8|nr:MAG: flagellar basal body L-ring protein [candidate division LCP-89 bacterium B3_LCP]
MRLMMRTGRFVHSGLLMVMLLIAVTTIGDAGGKKFSDNIARSLFSDRRAYQVGDVVTILIMEYSMGQHEAGTETSNSNELGLSAVGSGDLSDTNMGVDGKWGHDYDGTGGTSRSAALEGTLSARIVEITETGNLVIEGERAVTVNGEKQITKLRGVVRPEDISGQNEVFSYKIADAEITYTGKGDVNSAQKPGFFTKIINMIF